MSKIWIFACLFGLYLLYSFTVYTKGTEQHIPLPATTQLQVNKGKQLFQQYNCVACHQLYGLGGYLGPELTTAYSDPGRGETYMKVFLQSGSRTMPDFHLNNDDVNALISYLKYVDETAVTYKAY